MWVKPLSGENAVGISLKILSPKSFGNSRGNFQKREVFALKIFKVKRKKQGQWYHFVAEVDVTNKRIFCRSHPDVFCKKGALKYLAKLTGKNVYRRLFQKKFHAVGLQFYLKRGSYKSFFL